jgi:hemolysin type calcium-binding protein
MTTPLMDSALLEPNAVILAFDSADFVRVIDNPYFPLTPGTTYFSRTPDGAENDAFRVTHQTIQILGVTCTVVKHTAYEDGEIVEIARDYFAQDKDGNVWYFGEFVRNFVDGKVANNDGTWQAGVDGAMPGIFMEASPEVGDEYDQEVAPGVAEDHAKVVDLDAAVTVPYGAFGAALETEETTPLEPDLLENKYYVSGIGQVLDENPETGEMLGLVKIRFDGTNRDDTLIGEIGGDELRGFFGNDHLNGRAGADTIRGGAGNDTLIGRAGNDRMTGGAASDTLIGGAGNDKLLGYTGDDILNGRFGNDRLTGHAGLDAFVFNTTLGVHNVDTITDFNVAADAIHLENAVMTGLGGASVLAPAQLHVGAAAHDATDRIIYDSATGALLYDTDGNGESAAIQLATLTAGLALTNADFFVI